MQSTYQPQNLMQSSFQPQYSQIPVNKMANTQVIGTQSTYPTVNNFQFQHEHDPNFRSTSFVQNKEPMKASIVLEPKDRPLHTLQEFEFNQRQTKSFIERPIMQPPIVTQTPDRIPMQSYRQIENKKRDEYCGLFTKTRPNGYNNGKIVQDYNEAKENPYWVCKIF